MIKIVKYNEIYQCRICGSNSIYPILDLGVQSLTGVFPKHIDSELGSCPLVLILCLDCSLVQLKHTYSLNDLYGETYGYRSGLNQSMVKHLHDKAKLLENRYDLENDDIVVDIGSNDATLLKAYSNDCIKRIGIDPTGIKFQEDYTEKIFLIPEFFSANSFRKLFPDQNAKVITSISMFYDLESPRDFVLDIYEILDNDGIWHFEQSYLPEMLRMNSYDTICHEHLEYYTLKVVKNLLEECNLKILDVEINSINGGSFAVTAAKKSAVYIENYGTINKLLDDEDKLKLHTALPFQAFEKRVTQHCNDLRHLIFNLLDQGKLILGYGASTKGNVLLQYCGFTADEIPFIGDVNEDKFYSYTPGSKIPIIPEEEVRKMKPDYMLVLPWHFRNAINDRESDYLASGGKLIYPLPKIEIIAR